MQLLQEIYVNTIPAIKAGIVFVFVLSLKMRKYAKIFYVLCFLFLENLFWWGKCAENTKFVGKSVVILQKLVAFFVITESELYAEHRNDAMDKLKAVADE